VCPKDGAALGAKRDAAFAATMPTPVGLAMTMPTPAGLMAGAGQPALAQTSSARVPAETEPSPGTDERFDSLIGSVLAGRYEVVRRIGEGGMGAVYEAKHALIGKRVAVKVLLEKFVAKSDFVARLLQEARLASSIGHEHIVDVTDFGTTDDGRSFVVMEFLDGESLAQLAIREAPLPIDRCLRIARQAASALGAAHAKGIFHRDVKPENIYLIRRADADFVKVVDFGISKAVKPGGDEGGEGYRLTHTGLLLGTPLYMSPEQARGAEDLDHRVDIWALGVLMYECLTGEVPFRAANYLGIIAQVLGHSPMPPSELRPELGIPAAVEAVVMRAMEKDRDRRYQTMAELERDIERLLAGDQNVGSVPMTAAGGMAAPARPPRRWPLVALAAVVLAGGAVVALRSSPPSPVAGTPPVTASPAIAPPSPPLQPPSPPVVAPPEPAVAPSPSDRAGAERVGAVRRAKPRAEKPAIKPAGKDGAPSSDSVKRGVLPSGSREGYPDK